MSDAREATTSTTPEQHLASETESERQPAQETPDSPAPTKNAPGPSSGGPMDRGGWTALSLGFAGLLLIFWFWPFGLVFGLALDAAAITAGVRALRRSRQQRGSAPGARGGLVVGCIGVVLGVVLGSVTALFWSELQSYQQCLNGAITVQAREACDQQVREAIGQRLGIPPEQLRMLTASLH